MASEEFLARQNKVVEVAKEPQKAKTSGDASDGGVAAEDGSGADSEQGECVPEDSDSDVDLNTPVRRPPAPRPPFSRLPSCAAPFLSSICHRVITRRRYGNMAIWPGVSLVTVY